MLQIVRQLFSTAGYSVQLFKLLLHIALGSQLCLSHFAVLAESAHHSHSSGCVEMSNSVGTFSVRSNRRVRAAMNVQPSSDIDPYNDPSQMAEVDLLVLYTGDVLDSYGQTIRSEIERAVAYAQAAMQRSGVNVLLNVVHQSSISNPPAGQQFVKQLRMLTGRSDNQWDEVHSLRETHAADLVLLYSLSGFECGRAHLFEGDRTLSLIHI